MKLLNWTAALMIAAALSFGSSALLFAEDAKPAKSDEKPMKKEKAKAKTKAIRLTKPWSQISSLSEDQKTKLDEIHKKALDDINAIKARETEDCMAVLNDDQKAEITKAKEEEEAAKKSKKGTAAKKTQEQES
jgi:hypothetical protein